MKTIIRTMCVAALLSPFTAPAKADLAEPELCSSGCVVVDDAGVFGRGKMLLGGANFPIEAGNDSQGVFTLPVLADGNGILSIAVYSLNGEDLIGQGTVVMSNQADDVPVLVLTLTLIPHTTAPFAIHPAGVSSCGQLGSILTCNLFLDLFEGAGALFFVSVRGRVDLVSFDEGNHLFFGAGFGEQIFSYVLTIFDPPGP